MLIAESLIHEIDTARAMFGEVEVVGCTTARTCTEIVGEDSADAAVAHRVRTFR